ncbi:50S ribosomal protein L4 [Enterobacteriaceae bacterium ET-AT1-13]|nr:50S ribosomal protein L4 [Enterobacteriaceae bacterium ET-AT1-13]WGS66330.1 50S ribosomal protein L4 [Enterobacteriaceae bacterium Cmel17]WMC17353.1 MAG: 50S ribosomal protein L4 [Enterobacteriaceae bacterium Cmel21]WMC17559.1 MAG: 50S ribosomal protein L4 [Enterobacteriaceae bacterium PSmelAO3-2]WMC17764.1 MAG: 50S ribosomal protein L4 [Enterobacteriaceae bacterium PSmelAO3-1]WMC17967.1 MAG: 50S ribosomal protein L4 [Enterobacteriaceae bacterium PSmelAO1]
MEILLNDTNNSINISKSIFNCKFNKLLVHQVIISFLVNNRSGNKSQKNKSEVSGSNKKPWRQKGTGRARSGSLKSPIWRSGGVTFTSKFKKYHQKINKKMYRGAIKCIFSELIRQKRLIVFNNFSINSPKTNVLLNKIKNIPKKKTLIITKKIEKNLFLSSRNVYNIKINDIKNINILNLINSNNIITTLEVLKYFENIL